MFGKIRDACSKVLALLAGFARSAPRKLLVLAATVALAAIRAKHPDWALPDADFLVDVALAFLACHTLTDVAHISATALSEYLSARYGRVGGDKP